MTSTRLVSSGISENKVLVGCSVSVILSEGFSKSHFPSEKIYLCQMTGEDFF